MATLPYADYLDDRSIIRPEPARVGEGEPSRLRLTGFASIAVPIAGAGLPLLAAGLAFAAWYALRKAKAGRASAWVLHAGYWYLPAGFSGLKMTPPSHCRLLAG